METTPKNTSAEASAELWALASRSCNDALRPEDLVRLESLLAEDPQSRHFYGFYMLMHAELAWRFRADGQTVIEGRGAGDQRRGMAGSPAIDASVGAAVELPQQLDPESQTPNPPFPTLSTTNYPLPATPFVGSWAFSYMVATVIMGVAILGFWAYKITHYQHIAEAPSQSAPSDTRPEMVFVGRITGMVDVKWSDDPRYLPPPGFAHVPLGREYRLDSGLLEITYDSGAKVILEGPCTYEVESTAGGYLALGKLTARVEKDKETRRQGDKGKKADAASLHLLVSRSPGLPVSPLFSVRTPTAIITDLGTEFGVEVDESGGSKAHVFQGKVEVRLTDGGGEARATQLGENESARVEKSQDGPRFVLDSKTATPPKFVRRLVEPPKLLDLLDVVAGGHGMGWRRERGIDPSTGMEDPVFASRERSADRQYQPVAWHKLIDGVFVPDGRAGPVQLDSASHTFAGFPATDGRVFGSIWARAAEVRPDDRRAEIANNWVYAMGRGEQFTPDRRGLLGLGPNVGITFNLEAMRRDHPGTVPSRFRAVAGLADPDRLVASDDGMVDLWVFVDGRLQFKRLKFRRCDGAFKVDVELGPGDRFLTLAVTDGGDEIVSDWFVLGDPVLELVSTAAENPEGGQTMNGP